MKTRFLFYSTLLALGMFSCSPSHNPEGLDAFSQNQLHAWNQQLTNVIIADIFTPPVCSRIYAYTNVAAYEAMVPGHPAYRSLAGQLHDLSAVPTPAQEVYYPMAGVIAFSTAAKQLVFATDSIERYEQLYLAEIQEIGIDKAIYEASLDHGRQVGLHILARASRDGYHQRQALPRHMVSDQVGHWQPTPPDYMQGIEPHWRTLRTFVIDSANQFAPPPPTPFDTVPGSQFYQEALEVYEYVKKARQEAEKIEIAKFWDCNPNVSYTKGHVMFFHQKISPGGHWLSIASIVGKKKGLSTIEQAETFALTSVALADAFISCWDEKYRSDLVRPVTYIDRYIEPGWEPILQTPPFPEYTSGHSVISAAAATMLTHLHGDHFAFVDSTEVQFGMPARSFGSFSKRLTRQRSAGCTVASTTARLVSTARSRAGKSAVS